MKRGLKGCSTVQTDFIEAFFTLYATHEAKDISVALLCDHAGYSRSTFYRQFESIDDVLAALEDAVVPRDVMDGLLVRADEIGMREITSGFLETLAGHKYEYRVLLARDHSMRFFRKLKDAMKPVFRSQAERAFDMTDFEYDVLAEYVTYAKLSLLRMWALSNEDYDLAYLTKITDSTLEGALWDLVEQAHQCQLEGRTFKRVTIDELAQTRPWIAYRY